MRAFTRLSTPFHKYDHVCCVAFRFWRGATREHPPKWGCERGATKPEPKSDATLRAAVLFGPDVVAHSLQTPEGYARRSRLVWAKNPSPQTWSYLWNGVLRCRLECPRHGGRFPLPFGRGEGQGEGWVRSPESCDPQCWRPPHHNPLLQQPVRGRRTRPILDSFGKG